MANNNAPISEEIVAAITAAVEMMVGHKGWQTRCCLINHQSNKKDNSWRNTS